MSQLKISEKQINNQYEFDETYRILGKLLRLISLEAEIKSNLTF
jgi:hypothetical protein